MVLDTVGINVVKLSYSAKVDKLASEEEADGTVVVVVVVVVVRTVSTFFITDALEIPIFQNNERKLEPNMIYKRMKLN